MTRDDGDAGLLASVLDAAIAAYGGSSYEEQIGRARAEYDERRGRVFEDEELWETWTQAFLEWYVCERVLDGDDYPPAARMAAEDADERRAEALRALVRSHRSLFEVVELERGRVVLADVLGGARFAVEEQRALHGVGRGDVVEARLVGLGGAIRFARTFLYHPSGTRDAIARYTAQLVEAGGDRRDAIDAVAALRVRCERYKNLPPQKVYEGAA